MAEEPGLPDDAGAGEINQKSFLVNLYQFMKERGTPIERIPHLGFKQVNLATLYKAVEKLGGYEVVTTSRLWKNIYDELGGSPGSTSAATCTRRHYERLVLPYERHLRGEADRPLPAGKPRKQYKVVRGKDGKGSSAELKEQNSKRRPGKTGVQQNQGGEIPLLVANADTGSGSARDPRRLCTSPTEDHKCPGTDGATTGDKGCTGSPRPAGDKVPGPGSNEELRVAGGVTDGETKPGPHRSSPWKERAILSPLAKKKFLAQTGVVAAAGAGAVSLARPTVIQPPPLPPPPRPAGCRIAGESGQEPRTSPAPPLRPAAVKPLPLADRRAGFCCRGYRELYDRPTDLSLPRPRPLAHPPWAVEPGRPKACWVPPLSVALPRKVPVKRLKAAGGLCEAGPLTEAALGKRYRVVSPLRVVKQPEAHEGPAGEDKPGKAPPPTWLLAAPRAHLPCPAPALRERFPAAYLLPFKGQALYSSLVPSLAFSSFMAPAGPAGTLTAPGYPLDLYKHWATGPSYDSFLRHRLYPLASYPTPYLSAQVRPPL
ncbi:AT-rich interactive domain-containing protein 5A-like [Leucoraja erinacea]|uniref:AT-rich interactive domain-containing protein 5A-like n=1 Tax=Leucoraja erinaceus TaxID=7782 RepID=UPI00245712FF|nr:AT-rich interactive domain-containing protein 5A-like [Leucoraja erinacea]